MVKSFSVIPTVRARRLSKKKGGKGEILDRSTSEKGKLSVSGCEQTRERLKGRQADPGDIEDGEKTEKGPTMLKKRENSDRCERSDRR